MIDWLTFKAPFSHGVRVFSGRVVSVDQDGEVEWSTEKWLPVVGSYESRVSARSCGDGFIEISGNPCKFLQGHNVFGSDDVVGLAVELYRAVCGAVGVRLIPQDVDAVAAGLFTLSRVDVTESWDLDNLGRVHSALRSLAQCGYLAHRGRGELTKEQTLYFGKTSRRWSLKVYAKGQEITAHRLPDTLPLRAQIEEHAQGLLRVENVLRGMHLKELHLEYGHAWTGRSSEIHSEHLAKLNLSESAMLDSSALDDLPPRLRAVYLLWRDGHDLREVLQRRTFYRHRGALLAFGIDIGVKQPREESNVVPLRVVLHARPVGVPDWARGTPVYFEPAAA